MTPIREWGDRYGDFLDGLLGTHRLRDRLLAMPLPWNVLIGVPVAIVLHVAVTVAMVVGLVVAIAWDPGEE